MAQTTETYQFATEKATRLLGQMAFQVSRTVKSRNANAIHDLRVSIRRFTQVLTALKPCFPAKEAKKIRRRLGNIMTAAGEVRNRDIAVKLLSKYQAAEAGSLVRTLESQRRATERELVRSLRRWVDRNWTA